jgi:hypothetical protein
VLIWSFIATDVSLSSSAISNYAITLGDEDEGVTSRYRIIVGNSLAWVKLSIDPQHLFFAEWIAKRTIAAELSPCQEIGLSYFFSSAISPSTSMRHGPAPLHRSN